MYRGKITEDEIVRDWTLSSPDKMLIEKINNAYRLWVSIQICSLRLFGQFFSQPNDLESRIIAYIRKQLNLSMTGTVESPQRDATCTEYKKLIFEHL